MNIDEHKMYLNWLKERIIDEDHTNYGKLLDRLYEWSYEAFLPMDENREADGIDLRYRYGYECNIPNPEIASYIDVMPCTMLEMMVALALRCEREIMSSQEHGDRSALLFWEMISNMGLITMHDLNYDVRYVDDVVDRFLSGDIEPDGTGGLFIINNMRGTNLSSVELWAQANWYLEEFI